MKDEAVKELALLNKELEPVCKEEWEMEVAMARMKLRSGRAPGKEPKWRFTKATGRLERG